MKEQGCTKYIAIKTIREKFVIVNEQNFKLKLHWNRRRQTML